MIPAAFSVSFPAAMWALLSLLIPLLIHLVNRGRGRRVPVGHIALIRNARKRRVAEIKPTQWLLLLLRLCIFTLLTLLLAGLSGSILTGGKSNMVLVTPAWLATSAADEPLRILERAKDSGNTSVRLLQKGFPELNEDSLIRTPRSSVIDADKTRRFLPYLLETMDNNPTIGQFTVHATDYLLPFDGDRPALPAQVTWELSHPKESPLYSPGQYRVVIVYQPERAADMDLMHAVLKTLQQYRLPGLSWTIVESDRLDHSHFDTDWLILLTAKGLSREQIELIDGPTVVLSDAGSTDAEPVQEFIQLPFYPFSSFKLKRFAISDQLETARASPHSWRELVTTADGQPVLQERRSGARRFLQFNSRFNPDWSSIILQTGFPELLLQLMLNDQDEVLRYANARISAERLQHDSRPPEFRPAAKNSPLHRYLAIMLALLWICERWLSERKSRATG